MKSSISLILIILVKLLQLGHLSSSPTIIIASFDDADPPPPELVQYDFFYFVQTWPGFGSKKDKKLVPNSFTIHGLWPQRKKGRMPDCPTTPRFQPKIEWLL
ncbi:hypothetical protein F8388_026538 [Cannabis sativa]|uniref:Uncharacterized protein n=1 Tax=Cannabis sativa TaxID=3483 RepID=A0A7J6DXM7_CANSA|nr:hypothetical protein F8388_026538 [Cannabis sativa]